MNGRLGLNETLFQCVFYCLCVSFSSVFKRADEFFFTSPTHIHTLILMCWFLFSSTVKLSFHSIGSLKIFPVWIYWLEITATTKTHIDFSPLCLSLYLFLEYDAQLAPAGASESDMASSSYLEPNHNHSTAGGCGVKSRSGMPSGTGVGTSGSAGGLERPPGSMDRVLKIFHYFETNSEPCTWASNIRHGDATDVRVRHTNIS